MTSAILILASEQKIVSLIWIVVQNKQLRHLLINKSQTSERIVRDLSISPTKKNNCLDLFFKVTLCLCPKATQKQLFLWFVITNCTNCVFYCSMSCCPYPVISTNLEKGQGNRQGTIG